MASHFGKNAAFELQAWGLMIMIDLWMGPKPQERGTNGLHMRGRCTDALLVEGKGGSFARFTSRSTITMVAKQVAA